MNEENAANPSSANNFLDEKLFKSRSISIFGQINEKIARSTAEKLLALSAESDEPITIFISSPGGHVESGDVIYDIRYLVHQPSGGSRGDATDIAIQAEEILKTKARINKIISEETGRPLEQVEKDTDRDYWMSVKEAIEYGIVSKEITSIGDIT